MTLNNILTLLFGSGLLASVGKYIMSKLKANEQKIDAVCLGVQALLRDRLMKTYNIHSENGWAPIYVKDSFENMWMQYHKLGKNGVMDEIHEKFLELPDRRPTNED